MVRLHSGICPDDGKAAQVEATYDEVRIVKSTGHHYKMTQYECLHRINCPHSDTCLLVEDIPISLDE